MGFGILFCGWFFLLNIFYFVYTDLLCATVTLYGLYKLGRFEKNFKIAAIWACVFFVLGAVEFALAAAGILFPASALGRVLAERTPFWLILPRYAILCSMTVFTLRGVRAIGEEVDAVDVSGRAARWIPMNIIVYVACFLLDIPQIAEWFGAAQPYVYVFVLLAQFTAGLLNIALIYRAYARICLPKDLKAPEKAPKKARERGRKS